MLVTDEGIMMEVSEVQWENALYPMVVTDEGIEIEVSEVQDWNT